MAQSGEMFEEDQWDSQKENAAPRVDGKPAHEVHALAKQDGRAGRAGRAQHLQAKRAQLWHEAECSDQSADSDPLTHWLRVLELDETEQPSMASGSSYIATLEHIANLFRDDHRYKNDPRYVRVWIKLVRSVPEPADALAFMEARSIGEHLALYYECKAMFLEHRGAYSAADDALSLGIAREAQPLKRLQNRHEAFLERMRRRAQREGTSLSRPDVSDRSGISTIRRFGQPLESNSEQQIQHGGPSDEFVSGITSSRAMRADSGSSSISHLSVHMDEDMSATCLSASSAPQATWDYLPASAQLSKENTPGICRDWQSAAFKRKHKTGPHGASGFNDAINVFEDANEEAQAQAETYCTDDEVLKPERSHATTDEGTGGGTKPNQDDNERVGADTKEATLYTKEAFKDVMAMFGDAGESAIRQDDATMCTRDAMQDVYSMLGTETELEAQRSNQGSHVRKSEEWTNRDVDAHATSGLFEVEAADGGGLAVFVDENEEESNAVEADENAPPDDEAAKAQVYERRTLEDVGVREQVLQELESHSVDECMGHADDEEDVDPE